MKKLTEAIKSVEEMLTREKEKRVTLETLPPECNDARCSKIKQGFIKEVRQDNQPHCDVRIRNESGRYTLTAKFRPKYQEATTKISKEMFETLWPKTYSKQEKNRYHLNSGWVVDYIKGGRIVAEFEYKEGKTQARMPKGFSKKVA